MSPGRVMLCAAPSEAILRFVKIPTGLSNTIPGRPNGRSVWLGAIRGIGNVAHVDGTGRGLCCCYGRTAAVGRLHHRLAIGTRV